METAQLLLRGGGGLLAVLGTLWVCVRVVKARAGALGAAPAVRLRVLARAPLGRHASVVSVDVGDRVLVLGVGEHGVRLLAEQPALPEPAPAAGRPLELDLDGARRRRRRRVAAPTDGPGRARPPQPAWPAPSSTPPSWRAVVSLARDKTVRR